MQQNLNSQIRNFHLWIYAIAFSVLTSIIVGLFVNNFLLLSIPFGIIAILLIGTDIKYGIYLITILFVFSIQLTVPGTTLAFQIPTEPIIGLIVGLWILRVLAYPGDDAPYNQPAKKIKLALLAFLGALLLSVVTSTMHLVSFKLFINTLFYITAGVFVVQREVRSLDTIKRIIIIIFLTLIFVSVYTLIRFASHGFNTIWSSEVAEPFFPEHGSYAAALSIAFSIAFSLGLSDSTPAKIRILSIVSSIIFFVAIFFSYTRAAWLALVILFLFFGIFRFRNLFNKKIVVILIISLLAVAYIATKYNVTQTAEKNAQSITNVEANYSNLERISRWVAAIDMIKAKPVFGVGYGVYKFLYQKYRNPFFSTPISNMFAGPHNDYLQYFSEAGIFGITTWLLFLFLLYKEALKVYKAITNEFIKNILFGCLGGVLTYNVHAFFNGFLIFDKVAVPFWICIGLILSIMEWHKFWPNNDKSSIAPETI